MVRSGEEVGKRNVLRNFYFRQIVVGEAVFGDSTKLTVRFAVAVAAFAERHVPIADWPNFGNASISTPKLHSKINQHFRNLRAMFRRSEIRRIAFLSNLLFVVCRFPEPKLTD